MPQAVLSASKDTVYTTTANSTSGGTATTNEISYAAKGGGSVARLLFHFDLSTIPSGALVTAVTFRYAITAVSGWSTGEGDLFVGRVATQSEAWTETSDSSITLTFADQASDGVAHDAGVKNVTASHLLTIVQGWIDGTFSNLGFVLYAGSISGVDDLDSLTIAMREHGTLGNRPQLTINYKLPGYQMIL